MRRSATRRRGSQSVSLHGKLTELAQLAPNLPEEDTLRQMFVEALCDFVEHHTEQRPIARLNERLIERGKPDARC